MRDTTQVIAEFVADTTLEDIPVDCIRVAKNQIVDYVGVTVAGSIDEASRIIRAFVSAGESEGECTILGVLERARVDDAALVNGTQAHVLDFDDVNQSMYGHPSAAILPACFAIAEKTGCSGKRFLEGYILGIEVAAQLGKILNPRHYEIGWHATCTLGSIGAAVGVAKILDLGVKEIKQTIGFAASLAGGLRQNFGTMTKPFHAGRAAENGVRSALLIQQGWTASEEILDAKAGFFGAFQQGEDIFPEKLCTSIGNPFDLMSSGMTNKKYPSCAFTHPAIDAALELAAEMSIQAGDIKEVVIGINEMAADALIYQGATNGLEGKFSVEYCVVSGLIRGSCGLSDFETRNVLQEDIQTLLPRVRRVILPSPSPPLNIFGPSEVRILFTDGKRLSKRVEVPTGDPGNPMSEEDLFAKYEDCMSVVYDGKMISRSYDLLRKMETLLNLRELLGLFVDRKDTVHCKKH